MKVFIKYLCVFIMPVLVTAFLFCSVFTVGHHGRLTRKCFANPVQDVYFWGCSRIGGGGKNPLPP